VKIYACLSNDISEGFVWLLKPGLSARSIVRITNPDNGRSVFCEALQIDQNFLREYNSSQSRALIDRPDSSLVIGAWYRARLGLDTRRDYPLGVAAAESWLGKLRACMEHPQSVVRVAAWLGIISVALGLTGVALGIISLCATRG
jgi:hypothetical protein